MKDFLIALVVVLATLGPCGVIAYIGYASINALGKKPSQAPKILKRMIVLLMAAMGVSVFIMVLILLLVNRMNTVA